MKAERLFIAIPVLFAATLALFSFTKAPGKDIVTGGGFTADDHFNLNAVYKKDGSGTIGHFQWDGADYDVVCVVKGADPVTNKPTATIYLTQDEGETYFYSTVEDNGKADRISAPAPTTLQCGVVIYESDGANLISVAGGNITIHK